MKRCRHINNPQTMPKIFAACEQNGFKCVKFIAA